ncbi:Putative glycosyltransferase [Paraburkholderia caribensis MBA4]|uniref:Glycosyltransferase n=1 Tax=Paraburkholderia caribensis MBA4 TaxID=1323664 RepID=A0A0P0RJM2_9BURK|nr:PilZ domain-containing protein [Paraburkholderia caribensis]ALL68948.1 Putative glycosyltransferase [Paraburkholderia caribensis MBA4]
MKLVKLFRRDIVIGKPLRFPVYAPDGGLLLRKGHVIESVDQLEHLISRNAHIDEGVTTPRPKAPEPVIGLAKTDAETKDREPKTGLSPDSAEFPLLSPGPEVQLTVKGRSDLSFRVVWVGAIRDVALIVRLPGKERLFETGELLEATAVYGRYVYIFDTQAFAWDAVHEGVLHLKYPKSTQRLAIRKHIRIKTDLSVSLRRNDGSTGSVQGSTIDISLSGMRIRLPGTKINKGEVVTIVASLPVEPRPRQVSLNGIVRKVIESKQAQTIGVEFGNLSFEVENILQNFIFEAYTGGIPM